MRKSAVKLFLAAGMERNMRQRYVITKERIRGQEYLISALYDERKKMVEVTPERVGERSVLGNIYIGRVEHVVKNLNAAFVKISPEQTCYYSLEDCKNAVFTKKLSAKKDLVEGEELLVQVEKEAIKSKDPVVTSNLAFDGAYAVLTAGNRRLSVSSKLDLETKKTIQRFLEENLPEEAERDFGIIVRTNARSVPLEVLLEEIGSLRRSYESLREAACHRTCFSCMYESEPFWKKRLKGLKETELEKIVTDDREIFESICLQYGIKEEAFFTSGSVKERVDCFSVHKDTKISYYEDPMLSLSSLYGIKSGLEEALRERVWLKSGAYLIIEPTEALTVIDVNTGKNMAKKGMQENFLKINKEAAEEIARQIRLRNISGMILVDFMKLASKEAVADLLGTLRAALKKDPVPTQLIDMTKLGLVEITRKKVQKSLREILRQRFLDKTE